MKTPKNNGNNVDSKLDKLLKLAELNEKRWEQNEKRWEMLAGYIRKNEAEKKALMQKICHTLNVTMHTLNNFCGWIREQ